MKQSIDAIITYGWVRSSYAVLRNLALHGLKVAVCDSYDTGMCQKSKYSSGFYKYRNPFSCGEEAFIEDLIKITNNLKPKVLIPSHDETEIIAKYIDKFKDITIIPISSFSQISMANDKQRMLQYAQSLGLSVPITYEYTSLKELDQKIDENSNYVIKLRRSNSAKGVFYASGRNDTIKKIETLVKGYNLLENRLPIVQDKVIGEGWGVSCLYWHGEKIASFTHKRLREKIQTGGTSTLRASCSNPIIEEAAHKLLDNLKWHGLIMVEFKYDPITQNYWFIETNPRIWGSIHLAIESGIEFPYLLYLCATEGAQSAIFYLSKVKYKNIIARWYLGDLIAAITAIKEKKNIMKCLRMVIPGGADTYDDIHLDDFGSFIGEIENYFLRFVKSRSINPAEEGTLG